MTDETQLAYRQESYPLPRGVITAIESPDGAEARIELFDSGLIASRPMRDFDQALRCCKHVAGKAWGW
jgi:hypothetical protein